MHGSLAAGDRLEWLEAQLATHGTVTLGKAAASLGVSEMTIRRDLDELVARGSARRVRGGARATGPQHFSERRQLHARAKQRIAVKVATLLPLDGAVAFDASSTIMRAVGVLDGSRDLTVITNGPDTFSALQGKKGVAPLLTGGALDPRTGSLVGPLACRGAAQLAVRQFVASAAALDDTLGAFEASLDEAEVKRQFATMADEVILALDASKLGRRSTAAALDWDRIDVLVTELDQKDARLKPFRRLARLV